MNSFKAFNRLFAIKSHLITNHLMNKKRLIIQSRLSLNTYRQWYCSSANIESKSRLALDEREFVELRVDQFQELITSDELKEKIELILAEYEFEKYSSLRVPINLTVDDMKELLRFSQRFERKKFMNYLLKKEVKKMKDKIQKTQKSQLIHQKNIEKYNKTSYVRTGVYGTDGHVVYGLWHNTLFTRIARNAISKARGNKLRTAAMFGQKLVLDLDYDQYMGLTECRLLAHQLGLVYAFNKYECEEPFDLHFTNCKPNMPTMEAIPKYISKMDSPRNMLQFHKESYLDLFPKDNLVYLSPHSDKSINSYNHNDIYIIGGIIDKSCHEHLSYIKARKEGIRCYRLPIDEYMVWGKGSKFLCLNHIIAVLNEVKMTGDWGQALKNNIPQRKQKPVQQIQFEDLLRQQKITTMGRRLNVMQKFNIE